MNPCVKPNYIFYKKVYNLKRVIVKWTINLFDTLQPIFFFDLVALIAKLMSIWPLKNGASKCRSFVYYFIWWTLVINVLLMLLPTVVTTYIHISKNRFSELSTSLIESLSLFETFVSFIACKMQRSRLCVLLKLSKHRISKLSKQRHKTIIENLMYVIKLYLLTVIFHFSIVVMHVYNARFIKLKELPSSAIYPFPTNQIFVKYLLLLNQVFASVSMISLVIVDGICFSLMYAAIVKLEILKQDYGKAQSHWELIKCVKHHQMGIWFVNELNASTRFLIGKTIIAYASIFITAGLTLLHTQLSTLTFKQFTLIIITCVIRLYIYTQTAERISAKNDEIKFIIYNGSWHQQSREKIKIKIIIMQRCQKPLKLAYSKLMPPLNMNFFSQWVYKTFSLFMTIQTIQKKLNINESKEA